MRGRRAACDEKRTVYIGANVERFNKDPLFITKRHRSNDAFVERGATRGTRYCGYWKPKNAAEEKIWLVDKLNRSRGQLCVGTSVIDDDVNKILNGQGWSRSVYFFGKEAKVCTPHATFRLK